MALVLAGQPALKGLLAPGVWVVALAVLIHTGMVSPALPIFALLYYGMLVAGLFLAFRFHSSRVFLGLLALFLAERALGFYVAGRGAWAGSARMVLQVIGVCLPLDFILLALVKERGFVFQQIVPGGLLLFLQSVIVAVLCRPDELAAVTRRVHHAAVTPLPFSMSLGFATAFVVLLVSSVVIQKPVERGFFWALIASFLALYFSGSTGFSTAYFAASAVILTLSVVDTSYLLAYHDELTTLPSRRAFNDALFRLKAPYAIAIVDIDHFKRFNDTYGHEHGDQVLRLVANRLGRVPGGGQVYRWGGEEFAILFPGKTTTEVKDDLEQLRAIIEASTFRLRGHDRRRAPRGPDRRTQRNRGHIDDAGAARQPGPPSPSRDVSVTVSIGAAGALQDHEEIDEVIQSADKALYRAKAAGRNRVEVASASRRRGRARATGIA